MFAFSTKFDKLTNTLVEAKKGAENKIQSNQLIGIEIQLSKTNVIFLFHMEVEQSPWNIRKI